MFLCEKNGVSVARVRILIDEVILEDVGMF